MLPPKNSQNRSCPWAVSAKSSGVIRPAIRARIAPPARRLVLAYPPPFQLSYIAAFMMDRQDAGLAPTWRHERSLGSGPESLALMRSAERNFDNSIDQPIRRDRCDSRAHSGVSGPDASAGPPGCCGLFGCWDGQDLTRAQGLPPPAHRGTGLGHSAPGANTHSPDYSY